MVWLNGEDWKSFHGTWVMLGDQAPIWSWLPVDSFEVLSFPAGSQTVTVKHPWLEQAMPMTSGAAPVPSETTIPFQCKDGETVFLEIGANSRKKSRMLPAVLKPVDPVEGERVIEAMARMLPP